MRYFIAWFLFFNVVVCTKYLNLDKHAQSTVLNYGKHIFGPSANRKPTVSKMNQQKDRRTHNNRQNRQKEEHKMSQLNDSKT